MEYFLVRYNSRVVIYKRKTFIRLATGLVGMGDDSCWRGRGFESWRYILDGHFSQWFVLKIVLFVWKDRKWMNKKPGSFPSDFRHFSTFVNQTNRIIWIMSLSKGLENWIIESADQRLSGQFEKFKIVSPNVQSDPTTTTTTTTTTFSIQFRIRIASKVCPRKVSLHKVLKHFK